MALIYCNRCGKQVSDRAKTCPICGAPIVAVSHYIDNPNSEQRTLQQSVRPASRSSEVAPERKSNTGLVVLGMLLPTIAALLLLAVLGFGGWWYYSNYIDKPDYQSEGSTAYESTSDKSNSVSSIASNSSSSDISSSSYYMDGNIAGVKVQGKLYRDGTKLYGLYGYNSRSEGVVIEGTIYDDNTVNFNEYDYERGSKTGSFSGTIIQYDDGSKKITGKFTNKNYSAYHASLSMVHCDKESVPSRIFSLVQNAKSSNESRYYLVDSLPPGYRSNSYGSSSYDNGVLCTVVGRSNARCGPGSGYSVAYELYDGQTVRVVGKNGNWYKLSDGYWTHSQNLRRY